MRERPFSGVRRSQSRHIRLGSDPLRAGLQQTPLRVRRTFRPLLQKDHEQIVQRLLEWPQLQQI